MNDDVKMGCQAVISSVCAFTMGDYFNLERSYWAVMTSMLVLCGFWGETFQKALHRMTGTVFGFLIAIALDSFLSKYPDVTLFICVFCLFGIFFFRTTTYAIVSFFITLLVLLFLSLEVDANEQLGWIRIYETSLGCVIGLIVSALFFSHKATDEIALTIRTFLQEAKDEIHLIMDDYFNYKQHNYEYDNMKSKVSQSIIKLNTLEKTTRYESILSRGKSRKILECLVNIQSLAILISGFHEAVLLAQKQDLEEHFKSIFTLAQKRINEDFSIILDSNIDVSHKTLSIEELRPQLRKLLDPVMTAKGDERIKYFHVMPIFFYFNEIDKILKQIHDEFKMSL